jgi:uncharacterized membrane protein (DUF485 family)
VAGLTREARIHLGAVRTAERSSPGSDDLHTRLVGTDAAGSLVSDGLVGAANADLREAGGRVDPWLDETEFDSVEEVDAVARSLRRVALQYGSAILLVLLIVPVLSLVAPWWFARPILGGLTLNFLFVAVILHVAFLVAALLFNRVASRSEDEMLGRLEDEEDLEDV